MTPTVRILPSPGSLLVAGAALFLPSPSAGQGTVFETGEPTEIACAPRVATTVGDRALTVVGSQEGTAKSYFGSADTLVISTGRAAGVDVGQEYFVRRLVSPSRSMDRPATVLHTAGWVRIVAAEQAASVAQVVGICDGLQRGDFLEPLEWPEPVAVRDPGEPDYDNPGTILLGLDGRSLIAEHDYFVLGLGEDQGVVRGQRLTVFRQTIGGLRAVTELGEAVTVVVDTDATTARMLGLRDIVEIGDLVAPQR